MNVPTFKNIETSHVFLSEMFGFFPLRKNMYSIPFLGYVFLVHGPKVLRCSKVTEAATKGEPEEKEDM